MKKSLVIAMALAALAISASTQAVSSETMVISPNNGMDGNYTLANKSPVSEGSGLATPLAIGGGSGGSGCIKPESCDGITKMKPSHVRGTIFDGDGLTKMMKTVYRSTAPSRDLNPISI